MLTILFLHENGETDKVKSIVTNYSVVFVIDHFDLSWESIDSKNIQRV